MIKDKGLLIILCEAGLRCEVRVSEKAGPNNHLSIINNHCENLGTMDADIRHWRTSDRRDGRALRATVETPASLVHDAATGVCQCIQRKVTKRMVEMLIITIHQNIRGSKYQRRPVFSPGPGPVRNLRFLCYIMNPLLSNAPV